MSNRRRIALFFAILIFGPSLLMILAGLFFGGSESKIIISKETTYITEPLRPDGYPDYAAALEKIYSEGVTPENNAAVLLYRAFGPKNIPADQRAEYARKLGVDPLPETGDYLVSLDEYVNSLPEASWPALKLVAPETPPAYPGAPPPSPSELAQKQYDEAIKRPWSKEEFPVLAAWLQKNEKPLALVIEASRRSRYYVPVMFGDGQKLLIAWLLPEAYRCQHATRVLRLRIMLRMHDGQIADAWQEMLACRRIARLVAQGATVIEAFVGYRIDGMACEGMHAMLRHDNNGAEQLCGFAKDMRQLPAMPRCHEKINVAERYIYLDIITTAARGSLATTFDSVSDRSSNTLRASLLQTLGRTADWNEPLRMGNQWYDRIVTVSREPSCPVRMFRLQGVDEDVAKLRIESTNWKNWLAMLASRDARGRQVGRLFVGLMLPALAVVHHAESLADAESQVTYLAVALAIYRAERGKYPEKLADLAPKYIEKVPKDLFNEGDLHYSRHGEGYLLHSVGPNLVDDGGRGRADVPDGESHDWDDIVVRMTK